MGSDIMRLYTSPTSPYGRMARITVAEKEDPSQCEIVFTDPWSSPLEVTDNNPLRKVPILQTGDGNILDSRVICEYLDFNMKGLQLIPSEPGAMFRVKTLAAIAIGGTDAGVAMVTPMRVDPDMVSEKLRTHFLEKIHNAVSHLGQHVANREFIDGDSFTIADTAAVSFLGFMDLRFPDVDWRGMATELADWEKRMSRRSSVASTVPG